MNDTPSLPEDLYGLEMHGDFVRRHIGPSQAEVEQMLAYLEIDSIEELIDQTVPESIRCKEQITLHSSISERAVITYIRSLRERNRVFVSMIGMGYYGTVMPSVIKRNMMENPDWYTAYTPYQAEVSQGRLELLLNFQQMVCDLTAMELASASLLDEATAAAEAMTMSRRVSKSKSCCYFVDIDTHPQTVAVLRTRAEPLGFEIVLADPRDQLLQSDCFGALISYPSSSGRLDDWSPIVSQAQLQGTIVAFATDLLALTLLKPPGEMGADIVIGSSQRLGLPMGYGGPHAAFYATRKRFQRSIPGRLIGVSIDADGKIALRMALQTREQHIRREKATSNICTAQVLLAMLSTLYAMYHGPQGLGTIAKRIHRMAQIFVAGLGELGIEIPMEAYFDTIKLHVPGMAWRIAARARESRINLRVYDSDHIGISFDETTRRRNLEALWRVFSATGAEPLSIDDLDQEIQENIPGTLLRSSGFLEHSVFHAFHSETQMMRYLRRLVAKDISLGRSMMPLGSCTMKLNAATAMQPISYRGLSQLHPFAPLDQTQGYQQLFEELEDMLCKITGFDAISLQPNAGSQGEYAGLLCIRAYHHARGEKQRDICLIPSSAHGTNPASAQMAGLKVVVVKCDGDGNVDIEDLAAKAKHHGNSLAALMITYPSTHGVFEKSIIDICAIIHQHGGQVYLDGANLNAMLGICRPAEFGADVMHVNLHKTFAIPHGGGGPGVGPIGVKQHLSRFLPDHPLVEGVNPAARGGKTIGPVSAAPWGSAGVLPISWAYILMLGTEGIRRVAEVAILNANYIAKKLDPAFPVVYRGERGRVAHECIIDLAPVRQSCGITVDDIAKRLIDYGFHAPTMSWPVADSMMIEPTESESLAEIDRFCEAMLAIRAEIAEIESGAMPADINLLTNAPHNQELLVTGEWSFPYSREQAFFPLPYVRHDKYWPPVRRVNNVHGDRNLACACPPLEAYIDNML